MRKDNRQQGHINDGVQEEDKKVVEESKGLLENRITEIGKKMRATITADICFCCDITGSMDQYIEMVKRSIFDISNLVYKEARIIPRFSMIGYRDKIDPSQPKDPERNPKDFKQFEIAGFSDNIEKLNSFIKTIVCTGGDDQCEDVVGALYKVVKPKVLNWSSEEKFVILIVDAPTHGSSYYVSAVDYFPDDDKQDMNLERIIKYYSDNKINLIIFKCNSNVDKMISIIQENYKAHSLTQDTFSLFNAPVKQGIEALYKKFTADCSSSLSKSRLNNEEISKTAIGQTSESSSKWKSDVKHAEFKFNLYMESIDEEINFENQSPNFKFWTEPVTTGNFFVGLEKLSSGSFRNCYQLWAEDRKYIAKIGNIKKTIRDLDDIRGELQVVNMGEYFANKFNQEVKSTLKISFLPSIIFEVMEEDKNAEIFKNNKFFIAEHYMEGNYIKYNNNAGWINEKLKESCEFKLLQAFSHYTYCKSKGVLLIVDLQGVRDKDTIQLTDPAIHSFVKRTLFGVTNKGTLGISQFFLSHECNVHCKKLNLTGPNKSNLRPIAEDQSQYRDLVFPLPDPMQEKVHQSVNERQPDIIMILYNEVPDQESVFESLEPICPCIKVKFDTKEMPGGKRKTTANIWLRDPEKAAEIVEKHPKLEYRLRMFPIFLYEKDITLPNLKVTIGTYVKNKKDIGVWVQQFCEPKKFITCRISSLRKTEVRIWLEDPSTVNQILSKANTTFYNGYKIRIVKIMGCADLAIDFHSAKTTELEVRAWCAKFCEYKDLNFVNQFANGRYKTKAYIFLKDPSTAKTLISKYSPRAFMDRYAIMYNPNMPLILSNVVVELGKNETVEEEVGYWATSLVHKPDFFRVDTKYIDKQNVFFAYLNFNNPEDAQAIQRLVPPKFKDQNVKIESALNKRNYSTSYSLKSPYKPTHYPNRGAHHGNNEYHNTYQRRTYYEEEKIIPVYKKKEEEILRIEIGNNTPTKEEAEYWLRQYCDNFKNLEVKIFRGYFVKTVSAIDVTFNYQNGARDYGVKFESKDIYFNKVKCKFKLLKENCY